MPGNLRKKLGGLSEADYERARNRAIRASQICRLCGEAIDLNLKPVCRRVKTEGYTPSNAHEIPRTCGDACEKAHGTKPNPWSASADHKIPVEQLRPGDKRLVSADNLVNTHLDCNKRKGSGQARTTKYVTSKDYFSE